MVESTLKPDSLNSENQNEFIEIKFTATTPSEVPEPVNPEREAWLAKLKTDEEKAERHIFHCFKDVCLADQTIFRDENSDGEQSAIKPAKIAAYIIQNWKFKTDIETGILYFFNNKTWVANAEPYLEHLFNLILGSDARVSLYRNVEFSLKAATYEKIEFSKKIALENGLLDVETLEFKEYSLETADEMPFHYLPIKYDPTAECPNWEQFVKTVVTPDDIPTLQEWSGYCLLPDYRFHKIMWIVGPGRNGKGTWQRTIQAILGLDNVANVGLEEFDGAHRFSTSQLYGKLVNFCSEPKSNRELQTNLLKMATGQDVIDAEIKNKQKRLKFSNCAKITVLANKFPKVNDQTTAFKERRLFLKFPFEFTGKEQIVNIEQNWLSIHDERSGILNWMLKGLQRLLNNGQFTTSRTQEETELEFLRASDSVTAFLKETATFNKNLFTTRAEAKAAYEAYCDFYGLDVENEKRFTAKLKDTRHIKDTSKRVNGEKQRVWDGVAFRKLEETEDKAETAQQTLETVKSGTDGTDGTRISNCYEFSESDKKIKEYKTPVPSVPSVPTSNHILNETVSLSEVKQIPNSETQTIFFERLAPNNFHKCDGLGHEAIAAEFVCFDTVTGEPSGYWCKTHLFKIGKECSQNGFILVERAAKNCGVEF